MTGKGSKVLLEWQDLLDWQRDNEYILSGYRRASWSYTKSLDSILRIHNETMNIWSHLIGTLAFSLVPVYAYFHLIEMSSHSRTSDLYAVATYYLGITICFTFSTSFHTLSNHSPGTWQLTSHLDHLGIVVVIWGSTIASDHFGFYCDSHLQNIYKTTATAVALACAVFTLGKQFRTPTYRPIRVAMYGLLGLSAFVPIAHGVYHNGWEEQNQRQGLSCFVGLGLLNGTGAAIYAIRVPERWYPTTFDILGSSHQIMHILVMCGALSYSIGLDKAFNYWYTKQLTFGNTCP